jgi:hypothetical protein
MTIGRRATKIVRYCADMLINQKTADFAQVVTVYKREFLNVENCYADQAPHGPLPATC